MTDDRLRRSEWTVGPVDLAACQHLVELFHYSRGGSNTATYRHGLFRRDDHMTVWGVAWWIPPTRTAANAAYPDDWQGVLNLSRLVIVPEAPRNAASFLLGHSMALIDRDRWPCLVTYADEWRGHTGAIYRATNWEYRGRTTPEAVWTLNGRMVARKAGPKTRTVAEMRDLGAVCEGRFAKHRFVHITERSAA